MLIALSLLTIFAPGLWFPQMTQRVRNGAEIKTTGTTDPTPIGSSHGKTGVGKSEV